MAADLCRVKQTKGKMRKFKLLTILGLTLITGILYAQNRNTMSNQEVVETFLNGFNDPTKIQASLDLLTDDYEFENPMVHLTSKAEFIGLAVEMGKVLTGVEIQNIASSGEWVAVSYIFKSEIPGLESNFATEWFKVENGKITESRLIYDASEWRKVYAQMEG